jgi:hypothetical protein
MAQASEWFEKVDGVWDNLDRQLREARSIVGMFPSAQDRAELDDLQHRVDAAWLTRAAARQHRDALFAQEDMKSRLWRRGPRCTQCWRRVQRAAAISWRWNDGTETHHPHAVQNLSRFSEQTTIVLRNMPLRLVRINGPSVRLRLGLPWSTGIGRGD